ncbi:MAG: hypothetical protein GXP29_07015 [Planctomycetes bacterium]|nr:hypothetical protein [Planctomycetota bacterium]
MILNTFGGRDAVKRLSYLLSKNADEDAAVASICKEFYLEAEMIDQIWHNASRFVNPQEHMIYSVEIEGQLGHVVDNCFVIGGKVYRGESVESIVEGWDMPEDELHQVTEWEWFELQLELKYLEALLRGQALAQGPPEFLVLPCIGDDKGIRCNIAGQGVVKLFDETKDKKAIRKVLDPMFNEGVRQIESVLESLPGLRARIDLDRDVRLQAVDTPSICGEVYLSVKDGNEQWLYAAD